MTNMQGSYVQTKSPAQCPQLLLEDPVRGKTWCLHQNPYANWFESGTRVRAAGNIPSWVRSASCGPHITLFHLSVQPQTNGVKPCQSALGSTRALQVTSGSCYLGLKVLRGCKSWCCLHYVTARDGERISICLQSSAGPGVLETRHHQ